jgi:hypothetical protein
MLPAVLSGLYVRFAPYHPSVPFADRDTSFLGNRPRAGHITEAQSTLTTASGTNTNGTPKNKVLSSSPVVVHIAPYDADQDPSNLLLLRLSVPFSSTTPNDAYRAVPA